MAIISLPYLIEVRSGKFQMTLETVILADPRNRWNEDYLQEMRWPSWPLISNYPAPVDRSKWARILAFFSIARPQTKTTG